MNDKDAAAASEFDFHWNTSPTSVVCAFPYILGFTSDSIEIRLLVNGNLVHTAIMPELQMITSKRDIFFVTTAPEFMSKDLNIKGLQINELTPERRLVTTPSETSSNEELSSRDTHSGGADMPSLVAASRELHINPEHELSNLLEIPNAAGHTGVPIIQRARSLQKTHNISEEKPVIAKSNSCIESYNSTEARSARSASIAGGGLQQQPGVPPNSPRTSNGHYQNSNSFGCNSKGSNFQQSTTSLVSMPPISPTKRNSKYRYIFTTGGGGGSSNSTADQHSNSPERLKPLRVYRIPLAKLTGTHSHFHHMHSFSASSSSGGGGGGSNRQQLQAPVSLSHTKKQQSMDVQFPLCQPAAVLQE